MGRIINRLLVITAALAIAFGGLAYIFRDAEHDNAQVFDKTFPLCEYIDMDILRLNVTVIPYDGNNIRISYKNDVPLDIELGDNRLSVSESSDFVISVFAGSEAEFGLYLYLPEDVFYHEITIYTGSGNVNFGGFDSEKVTIITNSGDISCENAHSLTSIVTGSGYVSLDFDKVVAESSISSRSGDAEIVFPHDGSVALDFETELGLCETDLIKGQLYGNYMYSFNGGDTLIHAFMEKGTLKIKERE
jgi:hypothetical protein